MARRRRRADEADLSIRMGDIALFEVFLAALGLAPALVLSLAAPFAARDPSAPSWSASRRLRPPPPRVDGWRRCSPACRKSEAAEALSELWALAGVQPVGGRAPAEIVHRLAERGRAAEAPPLAAADAGRIMDFLAVADRPGAALKAVAALAKGKALQTALDAWSDRAARLAAEGIPEDRLTLSPAFGRAFGYYDGALFEVLSTSLDAERPVAAGGRYDGLMTALGAKGSTGAVGCMVRPWRAFSGGER